MVGDNTKPRNYEWGTKAHHIRLPVVGSDDARSLVAVIGIQYQTVNCCEWLGWLE